MNQDPLLERRSPLGIPYALLILVVFFFCMPSVFRAARLSLEKKENDVKDWLPSDFPETAELSWFAEHFAGESFVLTTWPGCSSNDQRLKLFQEKLIHESATYEPWQGMSEEEAIPYKRARQFGEKLQLLRSGNEFFNWGGLQEKWLCTASGQWHYITPDGRLYRWEGAMNAVAGAVRGVQRSMGTFQLEGQFVTAFGEPATERAANPFYNDLSLLCAPLFQTVQTGEMVVEELAQKDGSLWPVNLTDESRRAIVAKRLAMERLTGSLFAPAIDEQFDWTPKAFRSMLSKSGQNQLPADFDFTAQRVVNEVLESQFDGSLEVLKQASLEQRTRIWYSVYDAAEVEPPPRLTCVMVTLTNLANDNLPFALGRGCLGQARGRLLVLAEESGIAAPSAPSMAPPPFNKSNSIIAPGTTPLRMGGPPVDNVAIDEEGTVTLVRLVGYSILLGIVLSYICFRSLKITMMVFVVGGSSAGLSMGIVWWTSGRVDAILMSMPSLVYVLGLSGAIHVINYYRDEVRARGERGATGRAFRHALLPCALASTTTAIGLVSLFTSNLAPISNFGLYSGIGVMMTVGVLFSYLPAALQTFVPGFKEEEVSPNAELAKESKLSDWWAGLGRWITSHYASVTTVCLLALFLGAWGLREIKTSVQLLKLFDSDSRIIHDYGWLEDNFGKLVPMELVVRIPASMQADSQYSNTNGSTEENDSLAVDSLRILERAELVERVRKVVSNTLGEPGRGVVGQAMSANTFLPPLPAPSNSYSPVRAKFNRELTASLEDLKQIDYLQMEKGTDPNPTELWRISLRVAALSDVDYGNFIYTLREAVQPVLHAYETRRVLLTDLAAQDLSGAGRVNPKSRVLLVGAKSPPGLDKADLLTDEDEIDARAAYLSTLGELISGERIARPSWLDVSNEKRNELISSGQWSKFVDRYDSVVWLGSDVFKKEDFADAKSLIDIEPILADSRYKMTVSKPEEDKNSQAGSLGVVYTGVVPVVYKAQRTLLTSLTESIGLAFILIAGVMILLLNPGTLPTTWMRPANLRDGLMAGMVAMIPNVFPVIMVFGVMCHLGMEIDIGTMMTASVAMGVAVDDTIHFLAWFRTNLARGMSRIDAVIETYRRVGPAMTQTTIVGGLGLFVFALSTFTPTQRFGSLMLVMLATALVGDMILLPALLAGPAGRWFKCNHKKNTNPDQGDDPLTYDHSNLTADSSKEAFPAPQNETVPYDHSPGLEMPTGTQDPLPKLRLHFPTDTQPEQRRRISGK